jgi:hypothetical protein
MRALVLAFAPALASAYGIGLGEVSFVGEITAILVVLVVFSVGETAMRSVWLNFAFFCILSVFGSSSSEWRVQWMRLQWLRIKRC